MNLNRLVMEDIKLKEPRWEDFVWDTCKNCGDDNLQVRTYSPFYDGYYFDGELVKCKTCGATGGLMDDGALGLYIEWHEDDFPNAQ